MAECRCISFLCLSWESEALVWGWSSVHRKWGRGLLENIPGVILHAAAWVRNVSNLCLSVKCSICKSVSDTYDPYLDIAVEIRVRHTRSQCRLFIPVEIFYVYDLFFPLFLPVSKRQTSCVPWNCLLNQTYSVERMPTCVPSECLHFSMWICRASPIRLIRDPSWWRWCIMPFFFFLLSTGAKRKCQQPSASQSIERLMYWPSRWRGLPTSAEEK